MANQTVPPTTLPSGSAKFAAPKAHTPGPWTAEAEREGGPVTYVHAKAHGIADCNAGYPNDEANARLIAAAPDMLAALRAYLAAQPQCDCTAPECSMESARILARAAIAKAGAA